MNPILNKYETPFETVPFKDIKEEHFLPALKEAIELARTNIQAIVDNDHKATFQNVCVALERSDEGLSKVSKVFFNLLSAETNEELQNIAKEFSPMMTSYSNDVLLNEGLFNKVKELFEQKDALNLNKEEMMLLEKQYKSFARNGALLNEEDKEKLRGIDLELSKTSLSFNENVLAETNEFELVIDNLDDLKGLTESALEAAALAAKEKGYENKWLFTLEYPSFGPFMTYVEDRALREKVYRAFTSKCFKGNERDNQEHIKKLARLRHERACLLGYESHAHFILEERMAKTPDQVLSFLNGLLDQAKPHALKETEELKEFAAAHGGPAPEEFMPWDGSFWFEKLRKDKFDFDSEELKPYFKLENVIEGVFTVANKLYGLHFKERKDIPTYHEDVKTFEVTDRNGKLVSVFYGDFFPRPGKRSGAWMTEFRDQCVLDGEDIRPHVANVCNFSKPTESKPSLLTFGEVTTLFHEFGHGLHGMLSRCHYSSLSGPNVSWDFVELPSQILENWAFEKECLDLFAHHYETGETIPQQLIDKIKQTSNFHEGRATLRQLSFALLDMKWHSGAIDQNLDVGTFEQEAMSSCRLHPAVPESNMSVAFGHIFGSGMGGYSAGYYSYKWAEVLDADAFAAFQEKGIFDKETADAFRENVLERGGTEDPMELYKRFRGKEPTNDALMKRAFG